MLFSFLYLFYDASHSFEEHIKENFKRLDLQLITPVS